MPGRRASPRHCVYRRRMAFRFRTGSTMPRLGPPAPYGRRSFAELWPPRRLGHGRTRSRESSAWPCRRDRYKDCNRGEDQGEDRRNFLQPGRNPNYAISHYTSPRGTNIPIRDWTTDPCDGVDSRCSYSRNGKGRLSCCCWDSTNLSSGREGTRTRDRPTTRSGQTP
jgi:hypothetical protein